MYEKIVLPNGVRIVYENIPHVRSVSMGVWIQSGSRQEKPAEGGASHFIEHMSFKGTASKTAAELAAEMDAIGGQINAFTTKECTCFHGRVLDKNLPRLTALLAEMLFESRFSEADIENERGVIFEEIDMYNDTPEDLVSERMFMASFRGTSLARPILGTKASLSKMTGASLGAYREARYTGGAFVVAVSGSVTDADIRVICDAFSRVPPGAPAPFKPAAYQPSFQLRRKSLEQNHLVLGFPSIAIPDARRHAFSLLTDIFGGGMSSRLFQSVREERGLCYSVYAYASGYMDTGLFSIYTALGRDTEEAALGVILDEIRRLLDDGVTYEELERARGQVESNILMGLESTGTRMNRLGRNELYFGRSPDVAEVIADYDRVTKADLDELAREILDLSALSFSAVGRVAPEEKYKAILGI